MSAVYSGPAYGLIYTGAHDGTLIAWNFETGAGKYQLSDNDPTCTSANWIKDSKSVDKLIILDGRAEPSQKKLLSMTADQWLRFWDLTDSKAPAFKFHCGHPEEDSLSAVAATKDNNTLVTADTSGQLKVWDVSKVLFNDQSTDKYFLEKFFIIAHRAVINTIQIVDDKRI
jgi:WD40 repeat protein